jgi:hypothetical protein
MKQIPLTKEQFAIVDDSDFDELSQWKWKASWAECTQSFYATRTDHSSGQPVTVRMHRYILGLAPGDNVQGDHRNGETLDNRRENLRAVTAAENQCNKATYRNNRSGYKGVSWYKAKHCWRAYIGANGKITHLGYFDDLEDAARAYNVAAKELHGEFARLNVLPDKVQEAA